MIYSIIIVFCTTVSNFLSVYLNLYYSSLIYILADKI
jgi:hypothetical protein